MGARLNGVQAFTTGMLLPCRPLLVGGLHRAVQDIVIDAIELEREEQKMGRRRRQPLRHIAVKL